MAQHIVGHALYITTASQGPAPEVTDDPDARKFTLVSVTHPDFAPNEIVQSHGRLYDLPVDHKLPIQELTLEVADYDDALMDNAMRFFERLGAPTAGAISLVDGQPRVTILYEIADDDTERRRTIEYAYEGRIRSADIGGVTADGLQTITAILRPVVYKRVRRTAWSAVADGARADFETAREIDLLADKYEVNGYDLWRSSRNALAPTTG